MLLHLTEINLKNLPWEILYALRGCYSWCSFFPLISRCSPFGTWNDFNYFFVFKVRDYKLKDMNKKLSLKIYKLICDNFNRQNNLLKCLCTKKLKMPKKKLSTLKIEKLHIARTDKNIPLSTERNFMKIRIKLNLKLSQ
jgi:hypothetical protein